MLEIINTPIAGLSLVEANAHVDARGAFARLFCENTLSPQLQGRRIVQINHSRTVSPGAIRGMHFQRHPHAEMKLVRCLRGRAFDVAVDLRKGSTTFLKWFGVELSPERYRMIVIPEGFAHGFQALDPNTELLYLHTAAYERTAEGGIGFDDPQVGIEWPLPPTDLSERDRSHPKLPVDFEGL